MPRAESIRRFYASNDDGDGDGDDDRDTRQRELASAK